MRAVVQRRFGGPEVLEPEELPDPVPDREWSVVYLRASALNWHDVLVRQGKYGSPLPHVPGADGAGVDVETNDEVLVLPSLWWGDDESAPGAQRQRLRRRPGPGRHLGLVARCRAAGRSTRRAGCVSRRAGRAGHQGVLLRSVRPARHHDGQSA